MKVKNKGGWFRGMFDELTNYLWSLSTKNTGQQVSIDVVHTCSSSRADRTILFQAVDNSCQDNSCQLIIVVDSSLPPMISRSYIERGDASVPLER